MSQRLLRVKNLQKELFESGGTEWSEKDYNEKWFLTPFGADYDFWYKNGLYPVNFCSMCGDDLSGVPHSWDFIRSSHSRYGVRIYLCKLCFKKCGYVSEKKSNYNYNLEIYISLFKGALFFFLKVVLFYLVLPGFNYRLHTAIGITTILWYLAWFMSKLNHPHVNSNLNHIRLQLPIFLGHHAVLLKNIYYTFMALIMGWILILYLISIKIGIIGSIASIVIFITFTMRQQKNMKEFGVLGG